MEEQEIDWTNILKKMLNMKELTLDDFLMGIEKDFTDVDDDVPSEEPDLEDKMDDILNDFFNKFIGKGDDGFVTEDVMRKILDAMEKNKSNDIFIETLCESTIYMPISDSNRLKMLEQMKDVDNDNAKARVIATLSTDEAKIEEMKQIQDDNAKAEVIAALSTDEAKLKAISNIFSVPERYENTKKIKLPSDMTIGCEIESEGEKSGILYRLELFKWKGKGDGSLRNGIEMVSPIMHSDEQSVQGIYKICDLLKLMKNSCSERCGGHIHIGADYLKDKQAYANLLSIYGNTEELLYIIANDPKDVTSRGTGYDSPLSKKVQNAIESGSINLESEQDVDSFIKSLEEIQGSRYSGLNFCSYDKHKTIEFRLPNGTINPNAWIENINLFGGIVKTAQDISIIQKKPVEDRSEDENKKMELFEKLQTEGLDDKSKLETLLELVIDKEDRDTYKNRYNENIKLLTDEQKEDIKNGTSSKPIKTKEIGKKVLTGSERVNIEEVEKCERVMQEIEKNNNLENTREEK